MSVPVAHRAPRSGADTAARPLAVVTGASAGIGAALAAELAARGHDLLLVARRGPLLRAAAERLTTTHGVRADVRAVDLVDRAARAALVAELGARRVDVLCNNAGVASFGAVDALAVDTPGADALRAELELDVTAVHDLTLAVLPGMVGRGHGGLLFTGSVAGNLPIPWNATYAAAKAFVNHFAESVHRELAGSGVAVSLLAPGPVGAAPDPGGDADARRLRDRVPGLLWTSTAQAARAGVDGLERNRLRVVPGGSGRALSALTRALPTRMTSPLVGRAYRRLSGTP